MNTRNNHKAYSTCTLENPAVKSVLKRLQDSSKKDHAKFAFRMLPYILQKMLGRNPCFTDQYHNMADLSLQFSPEHGLIAYNIARAAGAKRIAEFGSAFGYSTIYLAAAVKDNGGGIVIGSEFIDEKVKRAQANLESAGLLEYTDIRPGDALKSLADPGGEIDMILLDGSKDLYLPVLKMLFPFLRRGGVVLADNVRSPFIRYTLAEYVSYMQDPCTGFSSLTLPLPDGFEFSVRM